MGEEDDIRATFMRGGKSVTEHFTKGRFLGKGGFATCYSVRNVSSKRIFAGKIITKLSLRSERVKERMLNEIKVHRQLVHPNIVQLCTFFEDKSNVYIILQRCSRTSLFEAVRDRKQLSAPEVRFCMLGILSGVRYIHSRNIIHHDLKLANVLFRNNRPVICDFGLCWQLGEGETKAYCNYGTPNYMAPEIIQDKTTGHGLEVDIWSLGVMLFIMLVGSPPFTPLVCDDIKDVYERIVSVTYSFPKDIALSAHAESLIRWMLQRSPSDRPTLDELENHPFLIDPRVSQLRTH